MSSPLQISGNFPNAIGNINVNVTQLVIAPVGQVLAIALASGNNVISVPAGTTLVIIVFPPSNGQTVTLKGVAGDTGILLNKNGLNILTPDSSVSAFTIVAGAAIALNTLIYFL